MSDGIRLPGPSRQLAFHELLAAARTTVLKDALRDAVAAVDPDAVRDQLAEYAPRGARAILAKAEFETRRSSRSRPCCARPRLWLLPKRSLGAGRTDLA